MAVSYEWDVETLDEAPSEANRFDPDITDHHHCDSYVEALAIVDDHVNIARRGWSSPIACRIVLVRDQGNDEEGLTDRSWAYVTDGKLPEQFNYGGGELVASRRERPPRAAAVPPRGRARRAKDTRIMPQISLTTLNYARDCFSDDVDALLDDPHGVLAPDLSIRHYVEVVLRPLAADLGYDLDAMLKTRGSPFKRERVQKLLEDDA